jgi:2-C-methyl-D-erythritol 4-phosphate cytidylyltransferase
MNSDCQASAVLVAAGNSSRMNLQPGERKPFLSLAGRTVLEHTVAAFDACGEVKQIVIVAQKEDLERIESLARNNPLFRKFTGVVAGGPQRTDSVHEGVRATAEYLPLVAIHDAARLLIKSSTIEAAIRCAAERGAALVAVPVHDTIKRSADGAHSMETLVRDELWAAQTPQVFRRAEILDLLERQGADSAPPTDDAALYERWIGPIPIVRGEATNLKMTTQADLEVVRALLQLRATQAEQA